MIFQRLRHLRTTWMSERGCPYGFRQANRAACGVVGRQYGGMPSPLRDDVRSFFDPDVMGTLPDVSVAGASVEDWQAVFDLVRSGDWAWEYLQGELVSSLPAAAEVLARPADAEMVELRVWPVPGVLVTFRPMRAEEIDFDVDLRELQGQNGVDVLCGFLSVVGRRLGKAVMMTAEGDYGHPALGFDPAVDGVVLIGSLMRQRVGAGEVTTGRHG